MASFLDDLSIYNAKAVVVIANAVADGQYNRANMMSGLKNTANDTTLTDAIRLNALTALINQGKLLDIPLAPYFPVAVTFADSQTYDGVHNDLLGLQGGTAGEYFHLTQSQLNKVGNAAVLGDITFQNLGGTYSDNAGLANIINSKQAQLSGTGFVKASGTTITYDNSTYLTTISGIAAGGQLTGTYPNPSLSNAAVIGKVLTGWNGSATPAAISAGDSILTALQKLNANLNQVISSPTGVTSVGLTNNAASVFTTTVGPLTGAATLNIGLNTQNANRVLASGTSSNGQQPTFRSLVVADLPSSGATPGNYGGAALIPQITVDAKGRITAISTVAAAGGGQVNSVGLSIPGIFGAVTNTGTAADPVLTFGLSTQSATYVWAGPVSGAATVPSFRALASTDIPNIGITQVTGLSGVLDGFLRDSLSDGSMWVGNTSNAPIQRVLSGDVTISNLGVTAIGLAKVQYNMIQDVTTQTLLGRYDAVDGVVQQVTLSGDFLLDTSSGILSLSSPVSPVVTTKGDLLGHDLTAQQRVPSNNIDGSILLVNNSATGTYTDLGLNWVAMSGDATITASGAITIANSAVTLGKMANLAANSFIGNNTGSAATPIALTATQATAMLNQFTISAKGLVPAASFTPVAPNVLADYFLNASGGWSLGGGGSGSGTVTSASQYSIPYYSVSPSGTTVIGLAPQTTNGIYFLRANVTASAAVAPDWLGSTGSGNVVLATSPTLTTPVLGVATATSINKVAITAPATSATLTLADGSTLATSGAFSTTLTATATTTLTLPTTGTLATLSGTETFANKTLNGPKIGTVAGQGHFHMHFANSAPTGITDYITVFGDTGPNKKLGFLFELDAFESYFQFDATTTSKTYTFPDLSGTVALNPMTTTGDIIYSSSGTTAARLGIGTTGQVLSVVGGIPAWSSAGAGNVVGPASSTTGNFAVYADTTGTLLANPSVATLSTTGDAVFNSSVTVGVSGATTGTIAFRNSTNSGRTIIQGSTSQGAVDINYYWPTAQGAAGQILANDGSGNLSWTAAGAGNMVLASTQTNTGAKTFNSGTFILAGATSGTTIFNAAATASGTITLPSLTGTVALLENAQTFTGAKTFQAQVNIGNATYATSNLAFGGATSNFITFNTNGTGLPVANFASPSAGTKIVIYPSQNASTTDAAIGFSQANSEMWLSTVGGSSGKVSFYGGATRIGFWGALAGTSGLFVGDGATSGFLQMNSTTSNLIYFVDGGAALPSITTTRSLGSKIVIKQSLGTGSTDYAIGYNTNVLWNSIPSGGSFIWYSNATPVLTLTGTGGLTIAGSIIGAASQDVFNTVSTTVNFAGAATTLTIGNTATAAQTVNMFTASTGASTYNFATGATASATTKTINIGTGGAAGSTTNITFGTSTTTNLRFFGSTNTSGKPTVTGSRGGNAALASFLTALSNLGLITDSTTA